MIFDILMLELCPCKCIYCLFGKRMVPNDGGGGATLRETNALDMCVYLLVVVC